MSERLPEAIADTEYRNGLIVTAGAFFVWGLYPLYWHALAAVPPLEVTAYRVVWCTLCVCGYLCWRFGTVWIKQIWSHPATLRALLFSGTLISVNWLLFIWAVSNARILEVSLGYFVSPLLSVLLGVVLLSERLNRSQWMAVFVAAMGVIWMTLQAGQLPWVALTLALSFATYGLIRKRVQVEAVAGLGFESLLLFVPAVMYLLWSAACSDGGLTSVNGLEGSLLVLSGLATAIPLICYAYGARRLPLSTIGFMQYLAPTLQLLIGVFVFDEWFGPDRAIGFSLIWLALAIYLFDGIRGMQARRKASATGS